MKLNQPFSTQTRGKDFSSILLYLLLFGCIYAFSEHGKPEEVVFEREDNPLVRIQFTDCLRESFTPESIKFSKIIRNGLSDSIGSYIKLFLIDPAWFSIKSFYTKTVPIESSI